MSDDPNHNLMIGLAIAGTARADANFAATQAGEANQRAREAEAKAREAKRKAATQTTDADLVRQAAQARSKQLDAEGYLRDTQAKLAEKEALILEWMHSNEAFKRLARQYGKTLGVTDEQRQTDFANAVVNVAEEDPKYAGTEFAKAKRKQLGITQ